MSTSRLAALLLALAFATRAIAQTPAPQPEVESFSPQGEAKRVRQVTARFTQPMVALGDPRLDDPFDVDCAAPGKGRWADTRNWVYDFDEDLRAGLVCRFTLKAGKKTAFNFTTGGPAVMASLPREGWQALDEEQVFLLKLDAPATVESVQAHAYCSVEGVGERIAVHVLTGEERKTVLDQRKVMGYDYLQLLWKNGRQTDIRARNRALEEADELLTVVRCERRLPPATQVRLTWGAGIATQSGIATTRNQRLAFRVRPQFTATVECTRANARAGCLPMQPIYVNFTAPVPRAQALGIRIKAGKQTLTPTSREPASVPILSNVWFEGPFPDDATLTVVLPAKLTDDAGRPLENASRFPLDLKVDPYPPLAKFSGTFGILESREGGVLPVTLRNVEPSLPARESSVPAKMLRIDADPAAIASWMLRVEKAQESSGEWIQRDPKDAAKPQSTDTDEDNPNQVWRENTGARSVFETADKTTPISISKSGGQKAAEVIGIPLGGPGFYVVELESRILGASLLGREAPRYVATSALVTDMAVHWKWGREASRAWVTRLSDGNTVADADIVIIDYCSGDLLWQGRSDRDGLATISKSLGDPHGNGACQTWAPHPLFVLARKNGDFTFTQSGWSQGIQPYQFAVPTGHSTQTGIYHTVLDRPLFRAGETVSMKHFVRQHVLTGMVVPADAARMHAVTITHLGSGQHYTLTPKFGADGIGESRWTIPKEAKLGDYSIQIDGQTSGQFKVEEYRLPTMRASVNGPPKPLVRATQAQLDLHVAYLSGGGASGLPVKVRTMVEAEQPTFKDYSDYQFGGQPLVEGVRAEGVGSADFDFESEDEQTTTRTQILPVTLDGAGSARVTIDHLPQLPNPAVLTAELEYSDANGEILTTTGHVRLQPAALSLGIRGEGWVASPDQLRFRIVALDLDGKPLARQSVTATLYQANAYSYRKRLIGGFYAYETTHETKKLPTACTGTTNEQGLLICEVSPGVSGQIYVRAEGRDAQGDTAGATTSMWLAGKDDWWFGGTQGDRMDVLPEKKEYEAGDTARFQVRMPFREATALVTVEREGVIRSFVTRLKGKSPVVTVPIEDNDAPNVFVSVLAVRGRVSHVEKSPSGKKPAAEITALVDLNKPTYRLGLAQVKVGWKPHRLDVTVQPAQKTYKVRDRVPVKIHVTAAATGVAAPPGTEVAIAAVDEALLELAPNPSWKLLEAMMGERGLEVFTSTAQMQIVGKRHYGRKAVPHGGGGGRDRDRAREMFDSLLLWQGRVVLDANGDAEATIPLNDSLSTFRIVAVAHSGAQLFGTGAASINTTQDIILLSGVPPLVREGDRYTATFTARNTTDRALTVRVEATMNAGAKQAQPALTAQQAEIPAGQAHDFAWQVVAPIDSASIAWDVGATEVNGSARDRLKIAENVIAAYPVRTYQATIAQLTATPLSMPAARPQGSIAGRGGIEVTLQAKLGSLDGVREFMGRYPYICYEQQLSRSVSLRDRALWDQMMKRLPAYLDRDDLVKYFATDRLEGDDTLTAYVLAIANEAGWPIPEAERGLMTTALTRFVDGKLVRRSALPTADLAIRKLAAIDALSRYGVAQSSMLDSISVDPNLWPTSAVLDWIGILSRVQGIPGAEEKQRVALGVLRARLNFQGTTMGFSTERSDALWWLMISEDSNANRMLLTVLDKAAWREDVPRLVRGALGRQQFGHWNTTVANAWGTLAMEKFSAAFESTPVTGTSTVHYGTNERALTWPQKDEQGHLALPWANGQADLNVTHAGTGAPWAMIRATAALPLDKPLSTGFKVTRTLVPVEQHQAGTWTRGDVVRVHLDLEAQSDMSWVVVDDPIPSGASILGSGLGGQSDLLKRDDRRTGASWLAFEERRFDAFRAYYRFVPKGRWSVEYTVRLNNPGTFLLPATRVEAMYAPEMLGETPNPTIVVKAASP